MNSFVWFIIGVVTGGSLGFILGGAIYRTIIQTAMTLVAAERQNLIPGQQPFGVYYPPQSQPQQPVQGAPIQPNQAPPIVGG